MDATSAGSTREGNTEGTMNLPTEQTVYKFERTGGQATIKGQMYEIKLIALLFLRLKNSGVVSEFHLATNVKGAGALDDIVVKYKTTDNPSSWKTCFVQLKHKGSATIKDYSFKDTGDFPLKKYFESYNDIKTRIENNSSSFLFEGPIDNCEFVLYTNVKLVKQFTFKEQSKDIERISRPTTGIDNFLKTESKKLKENGKIFNFIQDCNEALFKFLLENEKTRLDAERFLNVFWMFSGQPSEHKMDDIIKEELLNATKMVKTGIDLLYRIFIDMIIAWWNDGKTTLNHDSDILKITLDRCQINTLSSSEVKQYCLDIKFLKETLDSFKNLLDKNPILHIVTSQLTTKLSCTKLIQSLQDLPEHYYMFLSLDSLLKNTEAVLSAWKCSQTPRLVIVSESTEKHEQVCNTLCEYLHKYNSHTITVVSAEDDAFTLNLKDSFQGLNLTSHDHFDLQQLDPECETKIKMRGILFQGHSVNLGELLTESGDDVSGVFNDKFMDNILNAGDIKIGPHIAECVSYYIPRTLTRRDVLNPDVLKQLCDDVFIVRNITKQGMQKLVPSGENVVQDGYSKECRFLVLAPGSRQDTSQVYERKQNVHELKICSDGLLRWIKTKGDVNQIRTFIDDKQIQLSNPKTAYDLESRIILINTPPGMGKSTFVTHLAKETEKSYPLKWIIRIDLVKQMKFLNSMTCEDGMEFLEAALGINKQTPSERALFRHSVNERGNAVAILDGCDEIAPKYTDKCLKLLSSLRETKLERIIVTTRHSINSRLESELSTLAFSLLEFTPQNLRDFFPKFWNRDKENQVPQDVLESVMPKLMTQLEDSLKNEGKEFFGIPLHAMMLAEIYEDHFNNPEKPIPDKLNLLTLFEEVIDKKFRIIYLNKTLSKSDNIDFIKDTVIKQIYNDHMHAALVLLLDTDQLPSLGRHNANTIQNGNEEFSKLVKNSTNNTGIVESFLENKAMFLHRTFAEYFAALWFSQTVLENPDFLRNNLFTTGFKTVRTFFDFMLAKESDLHTAVINNDIPMVEQFLLSSDINSADKGGRSVLQLAASFGFDCENVKSVPTFTGEGHLVHLLLEHGADVEKKDEVLKWTAIEYAMHIGSWDAVEILLENTASKKNQELLQDTILERERGIEIGSEWRHEGFRLYRFWNYEKSTLVHQAAYYGHVNVIKLFLSLPEDFTRILDSGGATPLHEACLGNQIPVVQTLIGSLGDDTAAVVEYVNKLTRYKFSALHMTSLLGGTELIELLVAKGGAIWAFDTDGRTPLLTACMMNNVGAAEALVASLNKDSSQLLEYIHTCDEIGGGNSLHYAFRYGGSELIELFFTKELDIWALDQENRTPLHIACRENCMFAARKLIATLGDDSDEINKYINSQDSYDNTTLHCASRKGDSELIKFLISNGGDIGARNGFGFTPLQSACRKNNLVAAQTLIASLEQDSDELAEYISEQDCNGDSVLHVACKLGDAELIDFLISKGADIRALNNDNLTPLQTACSENNLNAAQALLSNLENDSADVAEYINMQDDFGDSALHSASWLGGSELIELLISKGGDMCARNKKGRTPLFTACQANNVTAARALISSHVGDSVQYIDAKDSDGDSVLHVASQLEVPEIIELLISSKGDVWARNKKGRTPLFAACENVARALIASLEKDPDKVMQYINMDDNEGSKALHLAARLGNMKLINFLISKGADIWVRNHLRSTPLHTACEEDNMPTVQALIASLESDAENVREYINTRDGNSCSALHSASRSDCFHLIGLLIAKGGDIWARDNDGHTPLITACKENNVGPARALIRSLESDSAAKDEYIKAKDANGVSALDYAFQHEDFDLIQLFAANS